MWAVILRDMRTRFFNHGLGFILVPLWPLAHMGIIIAIHSVATHGAPPFGNSAPVFYMTGILPFLAFSYVSRFMGYSLITNRAMLGFPVVKVSDILMGRAFLEIIGAFITLFFITVLLWGLGEDPVPSNLDSAVGCYLSILYLAFACGYLVSILAMFIPMILTIYQLLVIVLYVSSGVFFVATNLPDSITYFLAYNPIVDCIEWFRTAYFESYSDKLANITYVLSFATVVLMLGLLVERAFRRKMLEG